MVETRESGSHPADPLAGASGLLRLFAAFAKIGSTSFGGGIAGWMMHDFVEKRRWISEADLLTGLALAQAFPGMNVVNLSIWIGWRLRRGPGVIAAVAGLTAPSFLLVIALYELFQKTAGLPAAHLAIAGVGAAAIGLSLNMAIRATRRAATDLFSGGMIVAVFVAVFVFRLPVVTVVAVAAPIGVAVAYLRTEADRP